VPSGGGFLDLARFTPFGAFTAAAGGDYSQLFSPFFPQFQGVQKASGGLDPFNRPLAVPKTPDNPRGNATASDIRKAMANQALEAFVPGLSPVRRIAEGGNTPYSTSSLVFGVKTKPDTAHGFSGPGRLLDPVRPVYLRPSRPRGHPPRSTTATPSSAVSTADPHRCQQPTTPTLSSVRLQERADVPISTAPTASKKAVSSRGWLSTWLSASASSRPPTARPGAASKAPASPPPASTSERIPGSTWSPSTPRIIPLGSKLKIPDNPFGDPNIVFTAADTGGAIKGNRLDFFDWRGRKTQMNWGTRPITASIVGSGNPRRPARAGATPAVPGTPGTPPSLVGGTSPSAFSDGSGADVASLIQALMSPRAPPRAAWACRPRRSPPTRRCPAAIRSRPRVAGPPRSPTSAASSSRSCPRSQQLGQPADRNPGLLIPGTAGNAGHPGTPGARIRGAVGGSPIAGQRPHAPTHETSGLPGFPAFDYMANAGTPVVAPVTGKIVKLSGSDPRNGPSQGPHGPFGYSVYVRGNDGHTYYLTHLGSRNVRVGQTVRQGAEIGTVGNYAKYGGANHVHMGVH
jgi:hypothetical protein